MRSFRSARPATSLFLEQNAPRCGRLVQRDAKRLHLEIKPDAEPEQGHYYRSDHFSTGAASAFPPSRSRPEPIIWVSPPTSVRPRFEAYNDKHYHQPSDEYHDDWDFASMEQMAQFGFTLGLDIANQPKLPSWNAGDEFLAPREKSGVK